MPRLSPAVADRKRAHVQKAALRCFLELGYHGTSVRDIAAAAKLSLGSVYTYFPDKLSLFAAVLEQLEADFLGGDSALFGYLATARFPDDLPALARALAADASRFRDYFKMIYLDVVEFDGAHVKEIFSRMEPKFRLVLGARFEAVGKLGRRRRTDPGVAFVAVYLLFYQYFVLTGLFGAKQIFGRRSDEQVVAELVELFLHGIAREGDAA
ncbi:MAG TPA: TetR/AcrR family transcriptional regulator [Myxococcales bacterium]|nr:TetR/AcrR family transcriptional regulator [Myxococcales bacterium]